MTDTAVRRRRPPMAAVAAAVDSFGLDPLSTVARLALIPFMPDGVKVGIRNNDLVFFPPTAFGILRRTFESYVNPGCSRQCIYLLRAPVRRAVEWYGLDALGDMAVLAYEGLARLRRTYREEGRGNTADTLELIMQFLRPVDGRTADSNAAPAASASGAAGAEDISHQRALKQLRAAWQPEEIDVLTRLFGLLRTSPDQPRSVACVETMLDGKAPELHAIIREPPV